MNKKNIGITLGDPFGIGPEIIAKALCQKDVLDLAHYFLIGDYSVYQKYSRALPPNCVFIDLKILKDKQITLGRGNRLSGFASLKYLNEAVGLLKNKKINALVTAPVSKEAIKQTDPHFNGHTEFLAQAFKIKKVEMMFVAPKVRSVIVTRHIPVQQISRALNSQNVFDTIKITQQSLTRQFKIKNPLIAVCGLNPHAGEGGTIGDEEKEKIIPAINKAKKYGIRIEGPLAADTLFIPSLSQRFDATIAMYHDQGLGPIKALHFEKLVNLTLGLPFIRTSPAHGTAFDIAGKNKANPSSMIEAIKLASALSN